MTWTRWYLSVLLVAGACNLDTYGLSGLGPSSTESSTGSGVPTSSVGASGVDLTSGTLTVGSTHGDETSSTGDVGEGSTVSSDSSSGDAGTGEECIEETAATRVIDEGCGWLIPDPVNIEIDFDKINVDYDDGMGPQVIPRVDDIFACGDLEAWYYDEPDAPNRILACAVLCMKIVNSRTKSIDVKFGCDSIVPF